MSLAMRLDEVIDRAVSAERIVGCVVIAVEQGNEIYRRAAGFADREAKTPVADDTIFRFASITKPLVAATALALVDWEVLELDAPVSDYLPWFAPRFADGRQPRITIDHLLTHTAGFSTNPEAYVRAGVAAGVANQSITLEENMKRLASLPLGAVPGTQWVYSMATDVLGAVVAAVTGMTLGEAVARYVTGPLGMVDTGFSLTDPQRLSTAYADADEPGTAVRMRAEHPVRNRQGGMTVFAPERIFNPNAYQSGGGGMAGTAPDFMLFLKALLNNGDPILSPEMALTGTTNRIGDIARPIAGEGFSYFGAIVRDPKAANSPVSPGTNHWGGIYGNNWFLDPVRNLALVSFSNTAFEGCNGRFRDEIRDEVYAIG